MIDSVREQRIGGRWQVKIECLFANGLHDFLQQFADHHGDGGRVSGCGGVDVYG
ncbi:MAG: hypothetical protein WBL07_00810 [Thiothrix litoralis]|uniref:hypothetical protein n=1 Tax=Thiothrix litoralis TaxID=2891210 RepID=UPI003C73A275